MQNNETLEGILMEGMGQAEADITTLLGLDKREKAKLGEQVPDVVVNDKSGAYMAYDFVRDAYIFSREAANHMVMMLKKGYLTAKDAALNILARGEEVGHRIRLRLNNIAKEYLINPTQKMTERLGRINLEEYAARTIALAYANFKKINNYDSLWSRISNNVIQLFTSPFEYISHFLGYKKAEEEYKPISDNPNLFSRLKQKLLYTVKPLDVGIQEIKFPHT